MEHSSEQSGLMEVLSGAKEQSPLLSRGAKGTQLVKKKAFKGGHLSLHHLLG